MTLVPRRLPLWRKAGVIFIHVPKNAGTSVNEAVYGRFMGHVPARLVSRLAPRAFASLPSFSLLRDPVDRCRSAYRFARAGRGRGDGAIAGMASAGLYRRPEFESFERFVAEWLVRQDLASADPVFRTQASYVCDSNGVVLVDHLGRVESIHETEEWVSECLRRPVRFLRTNTTLRGSSPKRIDAHTRSMVESLYEADLRLITSRFG